MTAPVKALPPLLGGLLVVMVGVISAGVVALVKVGAPYGLSPLGAACLINFGGGLFLALFLRDLPPPRTIGYCLASGLMGTAMPNVMIFTAVSVAGAGPTGLVFAFPPIVTYVLAVSIGIDRWQTARVTGVLIGLAGAMAILLPRALGAGTTGSDAADQALLLAFLAPVSYALVNVYRAVGWPRGVRPGPLAAASLICAGFLLLPFALLLGSFAPNGGWTWQAALILQTQSLMTAIYFQGMFVLQQRGGPVYISLVGYVMAGAGLFYGLVFFEESYGIWTWVGAALVFVCPFLLVPRPVRTAA